VDSGEKNEVLLENPYNRRTISRPDVQLVVIWRMYENEPERTVTVWQENPIFAKCLKAPIFLDLGLL
jgi:hypothetical protein